MLRVERLIGVYFKNRESLITEVDVSFIELKRLREIFNPSSEDLEMIYVYPIREIEAQQLQKYVDLKFDFTAYQYYLECLEKSSG